MPTDTIGQERHINQMVGRTMDDTIIQYYYYHFTFVIRNSDK